MRTITLTEAELIALRWAVEFAKSEADHKADHFDGLLAKFKKEDGVRYNRTITRDKWASFSKSLGFIATSLFN